MRKNKIIKFKEGDIVKATGGSSSFLKDKLYIIVEVDKNWEYPYTLETYPKGEYVDSLGWDNEFVLASKLSKVLA